MVILRVYAGGPSMWFMQTADNQILLTKDLSYCSNVSDPMVVGQDLKDYMRKAGAVEHVRVMEDRYGRSLVCEGTTGNWTPFICWLMGQGWRWDNTGLV